MFMTRRKEKSVGFLKKSTQTMKESIKYLVASGIFVTLIFFLWGASNNKKLWCTQEIKSFNYSTYDKKDLKILIDTCEDEVEKYGLLEEVLYDYNNTNKFALIINQLYVNNNIENDLISNLDKELGNYLDNSNYNFDNIYANSRNNLPILEKTISKYLEFTKEILYTSYSKQQQEKYYQIFLYLFKNKPLIKSTTIPELMLYNSSKEYFEHGELKIDTQLMYIQKICKRIGKTNSQNTMTTSKDITYRTLMHSYNSYKSKDNKKDLLEDLQQLSSKILYIKKLVGKVPNDTYFQEVSKLFYYSRLYPLILYELTSYKLENEKLIEIFNDYKEITQILTSFLDDRNLINKLIFRLFNGSIGIINTNLTLYNKLLITGYKKGDISINNQFIYFIGINHNKDILNDLLKIKTLSIEFKRAILHSLIMKQRINAYYQYSDSISIIKNIISQEENFDNKSILIRDSLLLNNNEFLKIALKHIREYKKHYIKELNETYYSKFDFHYYSIFSYLAQTEPIKKSLREEKLSLFFDFLQHTSNNENKLYLLSAIQTFLDKDNITQKTQLKKLIKKEKNIAAKEEMLSKLKF